MLTNFGQWRHVATQIWVNIGSDNTLLPDCTKPLFGPKQTSYSWGSAASTWEQFHGERSSYYSV